MGKSSYPSQIDSDIELPRVEDNVTEIGGEAINSLRDAIFSIENAIGIDPQGNTEDLVSRINVSIDNDGRIKLSALSSRGLVTLPIVNSHIGYNAGINETKLDLDYSTAFLNGRITSNATDLDALRAAINVYVGQATRHYVGTGNRHNGHNIDLVNPIRSCDDVETILNVINDALTAHEQSISGSHTAYGISAQDEFINFSAGNVQDALVELDVLGTTIIESHQDRAHDTAVALNERGEQGEQGNQRNTVMAGTIYKTEAAKATNIFQVMRPNVARVTSKDLDLMALKIGTQHVIRIQAGGVDRGVLDINLSAVIPTDNIDDIVFTINTKAQGSADHYPISAYNVGGKLTIAHNIPGKLFTIQILDTVQFSAASALGFSKVVGEVFEWTGEANAAFVGGVVVRDLKSLVKKHYSHTTTPLNTIVLGLGDLAEYGLAINSEGRILCNITNHQTNSADNGTHYILGFPNNQTFILSSNITLGEFDIEIVADSVNFINSANGELYDIFVEADTDGYGIVTKSNRASYGTISGVHLRAISEDFPTTGMEWGVVDSSAIQLFDNDMGGLPTDIPTGFQGQLKVFAPDNVNSAIFEVTGVPGSARKSINVRGFAGSDDRLYIATVHYSGNYGITTLKFVTDRRKMGGSVENRSEDILAPLPLEMANKELRNNGVIRGLDVLSSTTSTFKIRGGRALVDGRIVDVPTKEIIVDDFGASKKLLLLNKYGNFIIKSEFDSGFSFNELTVGDGYGDDRGVAIICEFETDGFEIDGYFYDRRLIVSNIDKKLVNVTAALEQKIQQVQNTVQGSSWGFTILEAADAGDLASIEMNTNIGLTYVPTQYETIASASGFGAGSALITTRRFEFSDPVTIKTSVFRALGLTHINIFIEAIYTGVKVGEDGPFGVSGPVYIDVGVGVERGITNLVVTEEYARVKSISTGVLSSRSQTERYVASIPVSQLELPENVMFDVVPRIRIINSNYVDGGTGADTEPTIKFNNLRIVTSSYSVAGAINEEDGSSMPMAATVGEIF